MNHWKKVFSITILFLVGLVLIGVLLGSVVYVITEPIMTLYITQQNAKQAEIEKRLETLERLNPKNVLSLQKKELDKLYEELNRINQTSRGGFSRTREMEITAYTSGYESTGKYPGHPAYGITASGYKLTPNDAYKTVAADLNHYSFGQKLYVEGVGIVTVVDTGGDIKGPNRLDLYVGENVKEALKFGRQIKKVGVQ